MEIIGGAGTALVIIAYCPQIYHLAKEVITVHGKEVLVRDDTAKAFRGVKWGHIVVVFILLFMVILAIGLDVSAQ